MNVIKSTTDHLGTFELVATPVIELAPINGVFEEISATAETFSIVWTAPSGMKMVRPFDDFDSAYDFYTEHS